jgi:hypothetical protein
MTLIKRKKSLLTETSLGFPSHRKGICIGLRVVMINCLVINEVHLLFKSVLQLPPLKEAMVVMVSVEPGRVSEYQDFGTGYANLHVTYRMV